MKKYTLTVEDDGLSFDDSHDTDLYDIDLKIENLQKEIEFMTKLVMKNHTLLNRLLELNDPDF